MKRVLFIFAILGLTTAVAFGQVRENRPVSGFTGVNASNMFNITVQRGNTHSLVIEGDADIVPYVRSEVRNGVLHLSGGRLDRRQGNENVSTPKITIVMPNLEYVTLSGIGSLTSEDLFTPDTFRFNGSGVSSLSINLNTNQLDMELSGVSTIEINANVRGHSRFNSPGVSNISGNLVTERLSFDYSGTGAVTLTGSATQATINASGVPNLNLVDFPIRDVVVNAHGAGNIRVNATNSLEINAQGVSTIRYTGSATVQRNVGRMSNVSRL